LSSTRTTKVEKLIKINVTMLIAFIPAPWVESPACVRQYAAKFMRGTRRYSANFSRKLSNFEQKVKTEENMKWRAVKSPIRNTKTNTTIVTMNALMPKLVTKLESKKILRTEDTEVGKMLGVRKRIEINGKMMATWTIRR
jgi:hypothetical protein